MQVSLWTHPVYSSIVPFDVLAGVERLSQTVLRFRYVVLGRIEELVIPPPGPALRADNLWRTTCFEAFLAHEDGTSYVELNFSPSSQWAAYDFLGYRAGMAQASLPAPPEIELSRHADRLEMTATLSLDISSDAAVLNLCAVLEERGGNLSYWASQHPGDGPDFHRRDCFMLELPAASPA